MFRRKPAVPILPPEWLIVGLGNPGPEYAGTRHNIGFSVIDALAQEHKIKLDQRKHRAVYGPGSLGSAAVVLAKPLTFMNLSGQAIAPLLRQYGLKPDRLLVIADDLDLPLGKIRLRASGGAGGHNGHKSIIQALGTQDYPRLKIGIGRSGNGETIDHVLSKFHPDERAAVEDAVERVKDAVVSILQDGLDSAMGKFN